MASINPAEWSLAVQRGAATLTAIGVIIGSYFAVEAWAEGNLNERDEALRKEQVVIQVRNEIDHDKIIQSQRISASETNISITEMKLEQLEDDIDERTDLGREPTARQERSMTRLTKLLSTYEDEQADATKKLTAIHAQPPEKTNE